jgi:membrane protease YdiL (CAAX protease family)
MRNATSPRRAAGIELAVFVLLVLSSITPAWLAGDIHPPFPAVAVAQILHDAALVALVLYFVWVRGDGFESLGLRTRRAWRDVLLGLVLYVPFSIALALLAALLAALGLPPTQPPAFLQPRLSPLEIGLAVVLVVVVAIAEEILFRGYLLLRLRAVVGHTWSAVALASLLFATGHAYQGIGGMIAVAYMAIAFSVVYLWRKSLVAPIVLHFIQDFLGVVVMPWLER